MRGSEDAGLVLIEKENGGVAAFAQSILLEAQIVDGILGLAKITIRQIRYLNFKRFTGII